MIVTVHLLHGERRHVRCCRRLCRRFGIARRLALARGVLFFRPQFAFACGGLFRGPPAGFLALAFGRGREFGSRFGLSPQPFAFGGFTGLALALFGFEAKALLFARALGGSLGFA